MMYRLLVSFAVLLTVTIAGISGYWWSEVRAARAKTPALVEQAFERFGRKITATDLGAQRIALLLKIEDPTFRYHRGVDLVTPGAGMTTISQGLVKLLYFPEGFRPGFAKVKQTLIAQYALHQKLSKDEQLDLYLNATYFGSIDGKPVHGLPNAASVYFSKTPQNLTEDEFLQLIGMTISPNNLKPGSKKSAIRLARIKRYLAGAARPVSVFDIEYTGETQGNLAQKALVAFLKRITDADPRAFGSKD